MVPASFAFGREGGIVGATIAAALKKIAVYVLSNKKGTQDRMQVCIGYRGYRCYADCGSTQHFQRGH